MSSKRRTHKVKDSLSLGVFQKLSRTPRPIAISYINLRPRVRIIQDIRCICVQTENASKLNTVQRAPLTARTGAESSAVGKQSTPDSYIVGLHV